MSGALPFFVVINMYMLYMRCVQMVRCSEILMVLWSLLFLNCHKTSEAVLLTLGASQLQAAFADCAADIKSTYESQDARQTASEWPANSLNYIAILFLRAGRTQEAW